MKSCLGVIFLLCVSIAESHVSRRSASYSGSSSGSGSFAGSTGSGQYVGGSVSSGPSSDHVVTSTIGTETKPSTEGHYVSSSISTGTLPSLGGSHNYVGTTSGSLIPSGGLFGAPSFGGGGVGVFGGPISGGYGFGGGSSGGGFVSTGFHYPNGFAGPAPPDFNAFANTFSELFNRFQQEAQLSQGSGNFVGASSSGFISPSGGFASANVYPSTDGGVNVRFGEDAGSQGVNIPPPSGGHYGISTFSAAGQSTVDGKTTSFKKSGVTVNDNGKVTTYTSP